MAGCWKPTEREKLGAARGPARFLQRGKGRFRAAVWSPIGTHRREAARPACVARRRFAPTRALSIRSTFSKRCSRSGAPATECGNQRPKGFNAYEEGTSSSASKSRRSVPPFKSILRFFPPLRKVRAPFPHVETTSTRQKTAAPRDQRAAPFELPTTPRWPSDQRGGDHADLRQARPSFISLLGDQMSET